MSLTITGIKDKRTDKNASFNKQKQLAIEIGRLADKLKLKLKVVVKAR